MGIGRRRSWDDSGLVLSGVLRACDLKVGREIRLIRVGVSR